jgi:meso-butanediol dehydrogenase/(S,S)-butanediol dehydrogenase/diacetyl reductase
LLLDGDIAVVTGGGHGIGRAIALAMSAAGARIAIGDLAADSAHETEAAIIASGGAAFASPLDIGDRADCARFAAQVHETLGAASVLVNNAGILRGSRIGDPEFWPDWQDVFRVNVGGGMNMVAAFLPRLKETPGRIISIASTSAILASNSGAAYGASKAAVPHLTRAQAVELGQFGIRANALAPGIVMTESAASRRARPCWMAIFAARRWAGWGKPRISQDPLSSSPHRCRPM